MKYLTALLVFMMILTGSAAEPEKEGEWLIQVTITPKHEVDSSEYLGRVEVSIEGRFVGCAWAAWYETKNKEQRLVPMFIGYAAKGKRSGIRVETYGELQRTARTELKITPLGGEP